MRKLRKQTSDSEATIRLVTEGLSLRELLSLLDLDGWPSGEWEPWSILGASSLGDRITSLMSLTLFRIVSTWLHINK